jgi:hypothetical protein
MDRLRRLEEAVIVYRDAGGEIRIAGADAHVRDFAARMLRDDRVIYARSAGTSSAVEIRRQP